MEEGSWDEKEDRINEEMSNEREEKAEVLMDLLALGCDLLKIREILEHQVGADVEEYYD